MFKASKKSQPDLFSLVSNNLTGKSFNLYENKSSWHLVFHREVFLIINEHIFSVLYNSQNQGCPNSSIRILIGMMILKEAQGLSDQQIFEQCRFNLLTRSALGLINLSDVIPSESTYYLFRKRVVEYEEKTDINLFIELFTQITKCQAIKFNVSGKSIRMDSKLIGSNIARLSRYELIHETLQLFLKDIKNLDTKALINQELVESILKEEGNKIVYRHTQAEIDIKLNELGVLINQILGLFCSNDSKYFAILQTVFTDQYCIDTETKEVVLRNKKEISAKSIQSPHDSDCHFRNKDDKKVKGYSINVTESCEDDQLNLISQVNVQKASYSDKDFLASGIEISNNTFTSPVKDAHVDGAYHSPENQQFCNEGGINLYLHAMQGAEGRYDFSVSEDKVLKITDNQTQKEIDYETITSKSGEIKYRISIEKLYRYFTQKEIDSCLLRKKIRETPLEILQKRNNVEATIFQLGYHYSNAKSRYRGLIKHEMWANMRCLWINFIRINKFSVKNILNFDYFLLSLQKMISYTKIFIKKIATAKSQCHIFINLLFWSKNRFLSIF